MHKDFIPLALSIILPLAACGPDPLGVTSRTQCDDICRQGIAALLGTGALLPPPVHPYILPQPAALTAYHPTLTCSTIGSSLTGLITCQ